MAASLSGDRGPFKNRKQVSISLFHTPWDLAHTWSVHMECIRTEIGKQSNYKISSSEELLKN